jgi:hypothetical protein
MTLPLGGLRKDKAALLLYGGILESPVLIERADTANLVDVVLLRIRGAPVPLEQLAHRPCVGMALFRQDEWSALQQRGVAPKAVTPAMAQLRVRLYPAVGQDSAVIYDPHARVSSGSPGGEATVQTGASWIAIAAPHLKRTSIPVEVSARSGRCDVDP